MMSDDELRAVLIAEARRMAEQAGENPDSMTVDEEMLVQVMLAGRAVERAAYERAAQECFERPYLEVLHDDYWTACKDCADAIRALGGNDGN